MKLSPGTTRTLTFLTSILSVYNVTSPPATTVEAFHLSTSATTTVALQRLSHRKIRPQDLLTEKISTMPLTSLKGTNGVDNGSSSHALSSILDGLVARVGSTTSTVVAGTFFAVLCYKRDALMVSFFLGAIANAIFGKVLKKALKIERPAVSGSVVVPEIDRPSDNGMPSSHAMSLGFICTFVALLLPSTTIPLLAYAAISLIYRVRVNLHTVDQIAVGSVLGTLDGAAWYFLCTDGFRGLNIVDLVSSSGIVNEHGRLSWYLLAVPALIGAAVVGSVERRLEKYFRGSSSDEITTMAKED